MRRNPVDNGSRKRGSGPCRSCLQAIDNLGRRPGLAFCLLFCLSLLIQGIYLTRVPESLIRPHTTRELQAIAVSLAEGGAFADPYALPTGPTAHLPPIPPAIYGIAYRLFGLTLTGGYAGWILEMLIWAGVWGILPWVASVVGLGGGVGVLAGLAGASILRWPGHGENLAALAMGLLMVAFLRRWGSRQPSRAGSMLLGVGCGVAFHGQPAILPVVLGWMVFELFWREDRARWLHSGILALGMVLACLPWGYRNYRAFDAIFFVRSNFGLELRMGNHEGVAATFDAMDRRGEVYVHPRALETEARKVQEMGEVDYMREAGREGREWILQHPGQFGRLSAARIAHWWLGPLYQPWMAALVSLLTILALVGAAVSFPSMSVPARWAMSIPLLLFPVVHYLVAYMPRYREPVDWIFLLLAAAAVRHVMITARPENRAGGGGREQGNG